MEKIPKRQSELDKMEAFDASLMLANKSEMDHGKGYLNCSC